MKKQLAALAVVAVAIIAMLIVIVPKVLSSDEPARQQEVGGDLSQGAGTDMPIRTLQDCPAGAVAGVELECLGGQKGSGEVSDGAITVVNLWAWWCAPCREELPVMADFARQHPEYRVVGVQADANAANGAAFLDDVGVDLPSFQDSANALATRYSLPGVLPITLVVKDGEVVKPLVRSFKSTDELADAVDDALEIGA